MDNNTAIQATDVYVIEALTAHSKERRLLDDYKTPIYVHEVAQSLSNSLVLKGLLFAPHVIVDRMLSGRCIQDLGVSPDRKAFILAAGNSGFLGNPPRVGDAGSVLGSRYMSPPMQINQIYAGKIASSLGYTGLVLSDSSACASSLVATDMAQNLLVSGRFDEVAILAVENQVCFSTVDFFMGYGACLTAAQIDSGQLPTAFDSKNKGFVLGQGAAFMRLASGRAVRRSLVTPLAQLLATAVASEPEAPSLSPRTDGLGYKRVIQLALNRAGLAPADVDLIKTHGTGTASNDEAEGGALRDVFGTEFVATSYKPSIGHSLGASGLLELTLALHEARDGTISEIANRTEDDSCFISVPYTKPVSRILGLSSGMGNIYAAALLQRL